MARPVLPRAQPTTVRFFRRHQHLFSLSLVFCALGLVLSGLAHHQKGGDLDHLKGIEVSEGAEEVREFELHSPEPVGASMETIASLFHSHRVEPLTCETAALPVSVTRVRLARLGRFLL